MTKISGFLLGLVVVIVVAAALGIANGQSALADQPRPPMPVDVVNTDDSPVPVTAPNSLPISGTINVSGTSDVKVTNTTLPISGTVQAEQTGTWAVNVANTPLLVSGTVKSQQDGTWSVNASQDGNWTVGLSSSANTVQVGNATANPVPVSQVAAPGWQAYFDHCVGVSKTPPIQCKFSIPSGKRLVVEMVTVWLRTKAASVHVELQQCEYIGGTCYVKEHYMAVSRQPDGESWGATHPVKIYAVGTDVTIEINTTAATLVNGYQVSISGYAVDTP